MLTFLLIVASIAFGPAALLICLRLIGGPRVARAVWRLFLRWAYLLASGIGLFGLTWWAWVEGVAETDTGIQFGIALMLVGLTLFSGAFAWTIAGTRWVRTDGEVILR